MSLVGLNLYCESLFACIIVYTIIDGGKLTLRSLLLYSPMSTPGFVSPSLALLLSEIPNRSPSPDRSCRFVHTVCDGPPSQSSSRAKNLLSPYLVQCQYHIAPMSMIGSFLLGEIILVCPPVASPFIVDAPRPVFSGQLVPPTCATTSISTCIYSNPLISARMQYFQALPLTDWASLQLREAMLY